MQDGTSDESGLVGEGQEKIVKTRRPGGGRKKLDKTLAKEADEIYRRAHPEVAREIVRRALAQPESVICPACKHKFTVTIGRGDREALEHIDNRVLGKAKTTTEIDLRGKLELSSPDLVKVSLMVLEQIQQYNQLPTDGLEAQIKSLSVSTVADPPRGDMQPSAYVEAVPVPD